jgi:DNA-binding GntR family transcriptional regulator
MNVEKISTKTIRQQVYDQLKQRIICAAIPPGQAITIQGLASEFGVSVMPVREALWQLESEKVIVIESNKRIFVNALTKKEMEEALNLRLILEPIAAERACDRISEESLAHLKRIVELMGLALEETDKFFSLNSDFHFIIYLSADSPILVQVIDSLWARVGPYMNINWGKKGHRESVIRSHRFMYEALCQRDKKRLRESLIGDLKFAANTIIPLLLDADPKTGVKNNRSLVNTTPAESTSHKPRRR